jgi:hypothetical protein
MTNKARNSSITTRSASQKPSHSVRSDNNRNRGISTPSTPKLTHPGQPKDTMTPVIQSPSSPESLSSPPLSTTSSPSPPTTPSHNQQPSRSPPKHKTVNHDSINRRQCKRASDDLSRSTPDQNNLSQRKHAHSTRMTLKLTCPASADAEETLVKLFSEFIGELTSADSTAAVLPWKSIHRANGSINKPS